VAVLTYIGFDGISTLSEEVENPRRNVLLATVLTCLITGVLATLEVYAGQLVWPDHKSFPDVDTAFVHVADERRTYPLPGGELHLAGGLHWLGHGPRKLAAARLLYGMGRDNALPQSFFGRIDLKRRIPQNNVLFIGAVALVGAFTISYQLGAELLNFGAFIAFMGVNAAAFVRYYLRAESKKLVNFLPPVLGFVICFYIWLNLRTPAKIAGFVWLAVDWPMGRTRQADTRRRLCCPICLRSKMRIV